MASPAESELTVYESEQTSITLKILVSVVTGGVLVAFMSFVRWFGREAPFGTINEPMAALGLSVTVVMCVAALRSRVVRCLAFSVDGSSLIVTRDPSSSSSLALVEVVAVSSEARIGGWSRDPAGILVFTLRDGSQWRLEFPDDADTPAIASEIRARLPASAAG